MARHWHPARVTNLQLTLSGYGRALLLDQVGGDDDDWALPEEVEPLLTEVGMQLWVWEWGLQQPGLISPHVLLFSPRSLCTQTPLRLALLCCGRPSLSTSAAGAHAVHLMCLWWQPGSMSTAPLATPSRWAKSLAEGLPWEMPVAMVCSSHCCVVRLSIGPRVVSEAAEELRSQPASPPPSQECQEEVPAACSQGRPGQASIIHHIPTAPELQIPQIPQVALVLARPVWCAGDQVLSEHRAGLGRGRPAG